MIVSLLLATAIPDHALLSRAVYEAICDEIDFALEATRDEDIDRYMETVPDDYRIVEEDGSITDKSALRENQLRAWSIITRTNHISQRSTGFQLGCDGSCATVWTSQIWDRQMLGRDGRSEHNVVTTQDHMERWELRGSRWMNTAIEELGGTVAIDGLTL
jgi:hypothetical protein